MEIVNTWKWIIRTISFGEKNEEIFSAFSFNDSIVLLFGYYIKTDTSQSYVFLRHLDLEGKIIFQKDFTSTHELISMSNISKAIEINNKIHFIGQGKDSICSNEVLFHIITDLNGNIVKEKKYCVESNIRLKGISFNEEKIFLSGSVYKSAIYFPLIIILDYKQINQPVVKGFDRKYAEIIHAEIIEKDTVLFGADLINNLDSNHPKMWKAKVSKNKMHELIEFDYFEKMNLKAIFDVSKDHYYMICNDRERNNTVIYFENDEVVWNYFSSNATVNGIQKYHNDYVTITTNEGLGNNKAKVNFVFLNNEGFEYSQVNVEISEKFYPFTSSQTFSLKNKIFYLCNTYNFSQSISRKSLLLILDLK